MSVHEQLTVEIVKGWQGYKEWHDSGWTIKINRADGTVLYDSWSFASTKWGARHVAHRWIKNYRKYQAPNVVHREMY